MPERSVSVATTLARTPLLTMDDAPLIRVAIRADLGVGDLSDAVVGTVLAPASAAVQTLNPQLTTYAPGTDELIRAHDAAVLIAAADLALLLPVIVQERFRDYEYSLDRQPDYATNRAQLLRGMAYALLATNLGVSVVTLMRSKQMALADGGRGDIGFPWSLEQANRIGVSGIF